MTDDQSKPPTPFNPFAKPGATPVDMRTNQAHIAAVAAFDPEPAATLTAQLDRALSVCQSLGKMREQPSGRAYRPTEPDRRPGCSSRPWALDDIQRASADYSPPHSPLQRVQAHDVRAP